MKEISKNLYINEGNAPQYFTVDNLSFGRYNSAFTQKQNKNPGYATFNTAAKEILFPKPNISPFKLDNMFISQVGSGHCNLSLLDGNVLIDAAYSDHLVNHTFEKKNIQTPVVKQLTRSSDLKYKLQPKASLTVARIVDASITLYFRQYECLANLATGSANVSVTVSDAAPFEGESVSFSAKIPDGTVWDGWYSDAAGTQLVSKDLTYTTNAQDLTLYAKGINTKPQTSFYMKHSGQWKEYSQAFKKENGIWKEIDFVQLKQELSKNKFTYK